MYGNLKGSTHSKPNVAFHVKKSLRVGGLTNSVILCSRSFILHPSSLTHQSPPPLHPSHSPVAPSPSRHSPGSARSAPPAGRGREGAAPQRADSCRTPPPAPAGSARVSGAASRQRTRPSCWRHRTGRARDQREEFGRKRKCGFPESLHVISHLPCIGAVAARREAWQRRRKRGVGWEWAMAMQDQRKAVSADFAREGLRVKGQRSRVKELPIFPIGSVQFILSDSKAMHNHTGIVRDKH